MVDLGILNFGFELLSPFYVLIKVQVFATFDYSGQKFVKFLKSILKRQVNSAPYFFASFFIVMTHDSFVNFKLIHFLLRIKGSHQRSNFETFECSGKNLPNSLYHFPNHKSVFFSNLASLFSVMKDNSYVPF